MTEESQLPRDTLGTKEGQGYQLLVDLESQCDGHQVDHSEGINMTVTDGTTATGAHEQESLSSFVPAWEGLRGIAVLMTGQSHNSRHFEGEHNVFGRGGVAIFFVLSGYLITGVLMRMQSQKPATASRWSHVARFQVDRFARLYPAVITMIAITLSILLYVQNGNWPFETSIAHQIFRVLSYTANFETSSFFWLGTWSLAVEEQFYIVLALLLPILVMCPSVVRLSLLTLAATISYGFMCYCDAGYVKYPLGSFNPLSNVYKLLIGVALRLVELPRWTRHRAVGWTGVALLMSMIMFAFSGDYKSGFGWFLRQGLVVEPVLSFATGLILLGSEHSGNALLELQPLRFVGRVSYAYYLYQSPLQISATAQWAQGYGGVGLAALALVVATLTTLYIEEPLRKKYREWRSQQKQ